MFALGLCGVFGVVILRLMMMMECGVICGGGGAGVVDAAVAQMQVHASCLAWHFTQSDDDDDADAKRDVWCGAGTRQQSATQRDRVFLALHAGANMHMCMHVWLSALDFG